MEKKIKVQEVLGSITKNLECSICLDLLNNPVSTKCDHPFCRFCILEFLEKKRSVPCPLCKAPITKRSLNERPQLNSMVKGVRDLINAFQEDTGAIYSPPRGAPLMNLTPCTPESLPSKSVRGTKRKIVMESPKKTNTRKNCRQSKRRKSLNDVEGSETNKDVDNQNDLLCYLDDGSCGANVSSSDLNTGEITSDQRLIDKNESVGHISKHDSNSDVPMVNNGSGSQKLLIDSKSDEVRKNTRSYRLRDSKKNCNEKKDCDKVDLYNFNDSPVTPVHMLKHQRKCSIKDEKGTGDDSSVNVRNQRQCPDKLKQNTRNKAKNKNKMDSDINGTDDNIILQEHVGQSNQNRIESNELEKLPNKNAVKETGIITAGGIGNTEMRHNYKNDDRDNCSPDFQLNEEKILEVNCKTYSRQKNKPSHIKAYSKVTSWLKENLVNQDGGCHVFEQEEKVDSLNGDHLPMDLTEDDSLKTVDRVIEIGDDAEKIQLDGKLVAEDKNNLKNTLNKENTQVQSQEIDSFVNRNLKELKSKAAMFKDNNLDSANSTVGELKPIVSQKKRIFKSKPTVQTTSVCQKKGVLVIKKVSPSENNTKEQHPVTTGGINIDPFEFKSSQKTPVIPETKKSRCVNKGRKDRLKGKLDVRFSNSGKSAKSTVVEILDDNEVVTIEQDVTIETDINKQKNIPETVENMNEIENHVSIIQTETTNKLDKSCGRTVSSAESTDRCSLSSVIPGTMDESMSVMGKTNKKFVKLSNKMRKEKEEERIKEEHMEKMIEKINSAEDFDLLTCTQEVIDEMNKRDNSSKTASEDIIPDTVENMNTRDNSNRTASEEIIPDTADLHVFQKCKKYVSFALENVEISGTPRQTRRSVPMMEDRNKGRMLPKETRQGSKKEIASDQKKSAANMMQTSTAKNKKGVTCSKAFVWEEDEDDNTDGSSSTDDLDIHPSQEEFEMSPGDIQHVDMIDSSTKSKSQIDGISNTKQQINLVKRSEDKESHSNVPSPRRSKQQAILAKHSEDLESHSENLSSPRETKQQANLTKHSVDKESHPKNVSSQEQASFTKHSKDQEFHHKNVSSQRKSKQEANLAKHSEDKESHLKNASSPRRSQLHESLTQSDLTKESKKIVNGGVYVENTQEELYTPQQEHEEDLEVHVIPESVDIIHTDDVIDEMTDKRTDDVVINKNTQNDTLTATDSPVKFLESDTVLNDTLEDNLSHNHRSGVQKYLVQEDRTNIVRDKGSDVKKENTGLTQSETQSTVSTIDESLDSNNPVRKSRSKLRARKIKSQDTNTSDVIKVPTVTEQIQISAVDKLKIKNVENVSDTCPTSQESVSILIPVDNVINERGDNLKTTKSKGKNIQNEVEGNIKDINSGFNMKINSASLELIPGTDSESFVESMLGNEPKEMVDENQNSNNDRAEIEKCIIHESESEQIERRARNSMSQSNTSQNNDKSHTYRGRKNKNKNSPKTHEIYHDSDVEYISQSNMSEMKPIILSGSCEIDTVQDFVEETISNDIEIVHETMETDDDKSQYVNLHTECDDHLKKLNQNKVNDKEKIIMSSQPSIDVGLTPTLVSQNTLKLRNLAEKKRKSAEREIQLAYEQAKENDNKSEKFDSRRKLKEKNFSPEDIFEMDSEFLSSSTHSIPQNQEGLIWVDLESPESTLQPVDGINENTVLESKSCYEDQEVKTMDKHEVKFTEKEKFNENGSEGLKKKKGEHLSDSDIDSSQDKQAKRISGKRTVRGIAKKRRNLNSQNNKSPAEAPLIEVDSEIENRENQIESPCRSVANSQKDVNKNQYNSGQATQNKLKILDKKAHHGPKISPTFAYSPKKSKKVKPVKMNVHKKSEDVSNMRSRLSGQRSDSVMIVDEECSDSDIPIVTENRFENLLKDNIADTEISDDDELRETIREDKLNFSADLTLRDEDVGCFPYVDSKDKSKINYTQIEKDQLKSVKRFKDQDKSRSNPDIDHDGAVEFSTQSKQNIVFEEIKASPKRYNNNGEVEVDVTDDDDDIGFNSEPSSSLPDIIGKDGDHLRQNLPSESEDEDAVLIKSGYDMYDSDDEVKHLDDLDNKMNNDVQQVTDEVNKCDNVQDVDKKTDDSDDEKSDDNDDVKSDDNDDEVIIVKKKRRRIIEEDSDSSDASEDGSPGRHLDNTSSSAFSSQSEPVNTQQKNKLETELERMKREMKELQDQLTIATAPLEKCSATEKRKGKDSDIDHEAQLDLDDQKQRPEPPDSDDEIQEYQSDNELFLCPRSPSPPPMSPQQVDMATEETDFMTEFRKHDLELSPIRSSSSTQNEEMSEQKEMEDLDLKIKPDINLEKSQKKSSVKDLERDDDRYSKFVETNTRFQHEKNSTVQSKTSKAACPPKLMYSPVIRGDHSPLISPVVTRKGNHVLSPIVTNAIKNQKSQRCFVSTGLIIPQMKELQKLAALNQCKFHTKFSKEVTHVIVKTDPIGCRICDRTLKFFQGISLKCWILDYQWVTDCRAAGHFLPEGEYEIKGDTVTEEFHYGPRRARLSTSGPLFDDIQFLVLGNSKGLERDNLKTLLTACGGSVISDIEDIVGNAIVITCSDYDNDSEEDKPPSDELHKFKEFYDKDGIISVSREWVLDSLTVYKLQPITDYILTPGQISRNNIPLFDTR